MRKKQAVELFRESFDLKEDRHDKPMVRTAWNDFTDSLCKNGDITSYQYNNWVCPFRWAV